MGILLFFLVAYLVLCYGLSLVFAKAKAAAPELPLQAKDAWIPGINFARWCTLVGRKPSHALWLLVPIVNVFVYAGLCVDLARSFGRLSFGDSFLAVVAAPLYTIWLGRTPEAVYQGPAIVAEKAYASEYALAVKRGETRKAERLAADNPYRKSGGREWAEAIIFAVSAAWLIRLFIFEMFVIPTSSMEGSMLVGDYLVVSKAHYGIRTPQTIAMVPLLHNRLPFNAGESYLERPSLKMRRLPALEAIDRNDPIVFNFPLGDSVYVTPGRTWSAEDYRVGSVGDPSGNRVATPSTPLVTRPVDKKDHYVKRAVAVAGDVLEIRDGELFLNNERAIDPPGIQYRYAVTKPTDLALELSKLNDWGISNEDICGGGCSDRAAQTVLQKESLSLTLNQAQIDNLQALNPGLKIDRQIARHLSKDTAQLNAYPDEVRPLALQQAQARSYRLFPHDMANFSDWTIDNFGPIKIPKAGETVKIGPKNIALYRRIIEVYEGHTLEVSTSGQIKLDGRPNTEYTFKQDYFWGMGDNRHGSEDSRFWGFIPADHIVGKPLFIWFSTKDGSLSNGIRWNRIFKGATQMD